MASSTRVVPAGARLAGTDPFVVSNPGYFELIEADPAPAAPVVEPVKSAPVEKRAYTRKAKV
jgi:hypothetical protein